MLLLHILIGIAHNPHMILVYIRLHLWHKSLVYPDISVEKTLFMVINKINITVTNFVGKVSTYQYMTIYVARLDVSRSVGDEFSYLINLKILLPLYNEHIVRNKQKVIAYFRDEDAYGVLI
ncbi:hypothetical protein ACJX0J_008951, partial [Zea mays]